MDISGVEFLDYKVLTATLANFKHPELLGLRLFPSTTVEGNIATWDVYSPSRVTGNIRVPGAPATKVELMKIASRTATLAPVLLEKTLDDSALSWLRSAEAAAGDGGRAKVTREEADLDRVLEYTKEYTIWKALCRHSPSCVGWWATSDFFALWR